MDDARQTTVRSAAEWEKLWRQHAGEKTKPAVDFSKEMVLALFMGTRPTAGFTIEIVGVREDGAALMVQYRETRPPAGGITAQVLTSPYHIVAVPKPAAVKDVKFEKIRKASGLLLLGNLDYFFLAAVRSRLRDRRATSPASASPCRWRG